MRNLVIGSGEIGKALFEVLKVSHETFIRDIQPCNPEPGDVQVLNICFGYSDKFDEAVKSYQSRYNPRVTIIHSTVPVGTSRRLGAVHSPIHGRHNQEGGLVLGIKTFVKYVGGDDTSDLKAAEAARFLTDAGIKAQIVDNSETSELSKLKCLQYYGLAFVHMKETERECAELGANFEQVYSGWNRLYNLGYREQGMEKFIRPILEPMPGPQGGHCVRQAGCALQDCPTSRFILERNETYG